MTPPARSPELVLRPAHEADLPAAHALLVANGLRPGEREPGAHFAHLLRSGTMAVADDGTSVVGFAAAIERGGATFLTDCFVDPGRHGGGIGRRLLGAVLPATGPRWTFASGDPNALPLYVRFGMTPRAPLLYLETSAAAVQRLPAGEPLQRVAADDPALAALDLAVFGRPREPEPPHWAATDGAAHVLRRGGVPVAYAWVRPPSTDLRERSRTWEVGPAGGRTPLDAAAAVHAAMRLAAAHGDAAAVNLLGPHPAVASLLAAGARIVDRDVWMASAPLLDPARYAPSGLQG